MMTFNSRDIDASEHAIGLGWPNVLGRGALRTHAVVNTGTRQPVACDR